MTTDEYTPTEREILNHMAAQGWPTFDDIRYDHLDEDEAEKLHAAAEAAQRFSRSIRADPGVSLLLVAHGSRPANANNNGHGGSDRTGYGCGKTHLSRCIHFANSQVNYSPMAAGDLHIRPYGQYLESRQVMSLFDRHDFNLHVAFAEFGNLVVVDDIGREGALKWEKRDPEFQLQEKRDRYYSLVDWCYTRKISMVLTSNMTSQELSVFFGGAVWSRLLQMAPPQYRINLTGIRDMRPLLASRLEVVK
jgi:hypothetical protein